MSAREALVRRAVDQFNAGDHEGFLQVFAPEVVSLSDPRVADRIEYRGRAGLREWIDEALTRWSSVQMRALAVEPAGRGLLVELALVAKTHEGGGGGWLLHVLLHWTGDRVSGVRAYPDRDAALTAASAIARREP
jgi:SnoaL-like domain